MRDGIVTTRFLMCYSYHGSKGATVGWRAEQVTAPDCKSGALWHTGFESLATHHLEVHYGGLSEVSRVHSSDQ
jgi:hypothetical protein